MQNSPQPITSASAQARASPLKRSRAERSEGAGTPDSVIATVSPTTKGETVPSSNVFYRRPTFPPPPPPQRHSHRSSSPADFTGDEETAYLSASMHTAPHPSVYVLSPLAHSVPVGQTRALTGHSTHTRSPRPVTAAQASAVIADGHRKVSKFEHVGDEEAAGKAAVSQSERTPSRCATPHRSEVPETELVASRAVSSSVSSWTSTSPSSDTAVENTSARRGRAEVTECQQRASPLKPPHRHHHHAHGNTRFTASPARSGSAPSRPHSFTASTAAAGGHGTRRDVSRPSTLTSRTRSSESSSSQSSSSRSSSLSGSGSSGSGSSGGSGSSRSRSGTAAEKEDRSKHYPRFTAEYARQFQHDLVPFLQRLDASAAAAVRASPRGHGGATTGITKTTSSARPKSWIASFFGVSTHSSSTTQAPGDQLTSHPLVAAAPADPPGEALVLYNQFIYQRTLGKGTFSKVACVLPIGEDQPIALKVFRDEDVYREACWDEMTVLNTLCQCLATHGTTAQPVPAVPPMITAPCACRGKETSILNGVATSHDKSATASAASLPATAPHPLDGRFLAPLGYIPHPVHPAILYPMLGPSLLHVMRPIKRLSRQRAVEGCEREKARAIAAATPHAGTARRKGLLYLRGLPLPLLRAVLFQVLQCLSFMHAHGVVHTDLKPENILFESTASQTMDVPVFCLNLDSPCTRGGTCSATLHQPNEVMSRRKKINDAAKLHSARSSVRRDPSSDDHFPLYPSSPPGAAVCSPTAGVPGYAADPYFSLNRHLQHTITVALPHPNGVRVVDLGSARLVSRFRYACRYDGAGRGCPPTPATGAKEAPPARTTVSYEPIQTSHYRSPEVLLDLGWHSSADIFSLGCMIPELVTGDCLFMPNDTFEHLAMFEHIIGPLFGTTAEAHERMRQFLGCNARTFAHYFEKDPTGQAPARVRWPLTAEHVRAFDTPAQPATAAVSPTAPTPSSPGTSFPTSMAQDVNRYASPLSTPAVTMRDDVHFVREKPTLREVLAHCPALLDLTEKMLRFHPHDRITAAEALQHPFFRL